MKFTVKKSDIIDALATVQGLTNRRIGISITENLLIKSVDLGISIAGTDLESQFCGSYPAVVEKEGTIAVNSRKLYEIVREFPEESILIEEIEDSRIKIGNNRVQYQLALMEDEDFPEIRSIEDVEFYEIEALPYKKIIEKALIVPGADDIRIYVQGVLFQMVEDEGKKIFRIAVTDGGRLIIADYPHEKEEGAPEMADILIPKKGFGELNRFIEGEGNIQIGTKDNHFIIKKDTEFMSIRLLEGKFPKYEEIIQKFDSGYKVVLDKESFLKTLKRISILTSRDYRGAKFSFEKDKLTIFAENPELGEATEDMDVEYGGKDIEVYYNPTFFVETVRAVETEKAVLNIIDNESPCLLQGEDNKNFLCVIMPMQM